jgi:hypothetical protein
MAAAVPISGTPMRASSRAGQPQPPGRRAGRGVGMVQPLPGRLVRAAHVRCAACYCGRCRPGIRAKRQTARRFRSGCVIGGRRALAQ